MNYGYNVMTAKRLFCALAITGATLGTAAAQQTIGNATDIKNSVTGTTGGRTAAVGRGDQVYQDQILETGSSSHAHLTFRDKTRFSVGSNSKVVLDTFVYNPNTKGGKVVLSATKGAFRFVSGLSRKKNYQIKTPTASIGVRGTVFHLFILSTGTTAILLESGTLIICNAAGSECRTANKPGLVTYVLISGRVSRQFRWGQRYMQYIRVQRAFPFLRDYSPFSGTPPGHDTRPDPNGAEPNTDPEPKGDDYS